MVLILYGYRDGSHDLIQLGFSLWFLDKGRSLQKKADTRDELLARILGAATIVVNIYKEPT